MPLSNDRAVTYCYQRDPKTGIVCHNQISLSRVKTHGYVCTSCEEKYRDKLRFPKDAIEFNGFNFVKNPSYKITPLATYPKP